MLCHPCEKEFHYASIPQTTLQGQPKFFTLASPLIPETLSLFSVVRELWIGLRKCIWIWTHFPNDDHDGRSVLCEIRASCQVCPALHFTGDDRDRSRRCGCLHTGHLCFIDTSQQQSSLSSGVGRQRRGPPSAPPRQC
ncbi:hypothetical protein MPTK1_2g10100 [Marchantia polymorpha subsp. ruderalis]|uniref:Uncharacterized protein n=1 Tax=Marchantia polymorpha TaxID=3197 RepID=A0A2R6W8H2_MARPO|nr:hypothetical protein MARPO_0129s0034 [Marchantia polymorpha]BBN01764.1 hypothetical protein Mp_2g10100 [Marchantia polymorpha subsp. ruderalis]|eukprot:PTQ30147.1 hypothetical protein MARPO_0129s0034 [Marchantia polymorpha]